MGAYLKIDMAHVAGLSAADIFPNLTPIADVATTATHKILRGPRGVPIYAWENPVLTKKINFNVLRCTRSEPLMHVIATKAMAPAEAAPKLSRSRLLAYTNVK